MKNRFFSKDLYVEGLSQLKTVGIVTACVFAVLSLIVPLTEFGDQYSYLSGMMQYRYSLFSYAGSQISFYEIVPFAYLVPFVSTPILMFKIFWFMFKRNKSDFYHSIPQKRSCIYCSFTLSALTYIIAQIFICMLIGLGGCALAKYATTDFAAILIVVPNLIASSLLIASAILIAIGVTGRFFSALTVSCMILFYPRIFYSIYISVMVSSVTAIDGTHFLPDSLLKLNSAFNYRCSIYSFIYTFILASVYFVFGMFLFKRKKSQTAEKPTSSKKAHSIIRICFSLLFCAVGVAIFYFKMFGDFYSKLNHDQVFSYTNIIIIFLIALLSYFIYDIIANRSAKGLLKAVKDLVFLVIANVLMFAILMGSSFVFTSYTPKVENIESINILSCTEYDVSSEYDDYGNYYFDDFSINPFDRVMDFITNTYYGDYYEEWYDEEDDNYDDLDTSEYSSFIDSKNVEELYNRLFTKPVTDKEAISIICNAYNENYSKFRILKCKINEKSRTYYRDIIFSQEQLERLAKSIEFDAKEFVNSFEKLTENASNIRIWNYLDNAGFDSSAKNAILKASVKDFKNMTSQELSTIYYERIMNSSNIYSSRSDGDYLDYEVNAGIGFMTKDKKYYAYNIFPFMTNTIDTIAHYSEKFWRNDNDKQLFKRFFKELKANSIIFSDDEEFENSVNNSLCYFVPFEAFYDERAYMIKKSSQKDFLKEIEKRGLDISKRNSKDEMATFIKYCPANSNETLYKYIYIPKDLFQKYISPKNIY